MLVLLVLVALVLVLAHAFLKWNNGYWRRRGVKQLEPALFFGNFKDNYYGKQSIADVYMDIYNAFPDKPWVGAYSFMFSQLVIRDPDVIRDVFTTHFNSIHDNDFQISDEVDPILSRDPFFAIGETWKTRRTFFTSQLTPAKVKAVFPRMLEVCETTNEYLETLGHKSGVGEGVEFRDLARRFMVDILAAAAFGLKSDSINNDDSFFMKIANQTKESLDNVGLLHSLINSISPSLGIWLGGSLIGKEVENMLKQCVREQQELRRKTGFSGVDFMSTLFQKQQNGSEDCKTVTDVTGFLALFFLEGFEGPSNALTFTILEIARNPDVQLRLREEINEKLPNNAEITYEAVVSMEFLDQVFCEALRMHPVGFFLLKRVVKPVTLTSPSGDKVTLASGDRVAVPIHAISKDPKHFPDPDNFDPSRFTEEGKKTWKKGAFTPFGDGPRACPGIRFTNAVLKSAIVNIVRNFELELGSNMKYPISIRKECFLYIAEDGVMLRFVKL